MKHELCGGCEHRTRGKRRDTGNELGVRNGGRGRVSGEGSYVEEGCDLCGEN